MSASQFQGSHASTACPSDGGVLRLKWLLGISGMTMTGRNRSHMRKTCPNVTVSTTISHGVACDRTRASAVRVWRLTAWPMARPWSAKFRYVTCINNPVPAAKSTHFASLNKSSWLMLNTYIIVVVRTIQIPRIRPVGKIQGLLSCQIMAYI
jgi:hypothetical protein